MARKDWLTGQPLERQGPNPIAGFLAGLMQAQAGKQQQEDAQRREQQKMAMMQIQEGRTLLEKAAQMDPALWGDGDFVNAWKTGSVDYLAQSGWKPPVQEQTVDYEKTAKQDAWKRYQEGTATEKDLALIGLAPKATQDRPVSLSEGGVLIDPKTGKVIYKNPKTYKPERGGKPEKTRWATRQIIMEDKKSHLIQYDMDDANNRSKWVDLGVAGSTTVNTTKPSVLETWGSGLATTPETQSLDDEDALFINNIKQALSQ